MGDAKGSLDNLCILIAEDSERVAELLAELIQLHGGTVAGPAACEEEAWKIIGDTAVDGAILDVRIKGRTSLALADELLRRDVPVILITGYAASQIPDTHSQLPVFTKPFHMGALVECLVERCRDRAKRPAI